MSNFTVKEKNKKESKSIVYEWNQVLRKLSVHVCVYLYLSLQLWCKYQNGIPDIFHPS